MNLPIVYAYPCRWDMTPSRQRYLMEAMSAHAPVVFLNEPVFGGRWDIKRPRAQQIAPNMTVIHDAFGFRFSRVGLRLGRSAAMIDSIWLHRLLRSIGVEEYIYWLSISSPRLLWGMQRDRLVLDCIDPCFDPSQQAQLDAIEFKIAREAKLVFCTAESLLDRLRPINHNSHLLSNACSAREYLPESTRELSIPDSLVNRKGPVIGFMGTFDCRIDTQTLVETAKRLPDYTFALVGRVNSDQEQRVRPLRELPNVIVTGAVSLEVGRRYTAAFDVALIPFLPGAIGDAINPVKMYMYLAAGKPVVSTWVRECRRHAPFVKATQDVEEFVAAIRDAATGNDEVTAADRIAFAMKNTWQDRARTAIEHLQASGLLSENSPTAAVAGATL